MTHIDRLNPSYHATSGVHGNPIDYHTTWNCRDCAVLALVNMYGLTRRQRKALDRRGEILIGRERWLEVCFF